MEVRYDKGTNTSCVIYIYATIEEAIKFIEKCGSSSELWEIIHYKNGNIARIIPNSDVDEVAFIESLSDNHSMVKIISIVYGKHHGFGDIQHVWSYEHSVILRFRCKEERFNALGIIEMYSSFELIGIVEVHIQENIMSVLKALSVVGAKFSTEIRPSIYNRNIESIKQWKEFLQNKD